MQETWVRSWGWEDPLEKTVPTHSSIFAREFHGQRSLVGYSSRGCKELGMTEQLTLSLSLASYYQTSLPLATLSAADDLEFCISASQTVSGKGFFFF